MRPLCATSLVLPILLSLAGHAFGQPVNATTDDGKTVTLFEDGTWKYKEQAETPKVKGAHFRPGDSTASVQSKKGFVKLWYNPDKWKLKTTHFNDASEFEFEHEKGDAYAMIVVERMAAPIEGLRKMVTDRWMSVDKNSKVVLEEERTVNGTKVLVLQDEVAVNSIPFKYYGYYWTGKSGCFQLTVYTSQNLFDEYAGDFTDLLDGVTILKQ